MRIRYALAASAVIAAIAAALAVPGGAGASSVGAVADQAAVKVRAEAVTTIRARNAVGSRKATYLRSKAATARLYAKLVADRKLAARAGIAHRDGWARILKSDLDLYTARHAQMISAYSAYLASVRSSGAAEISFAAASRQAISTANAAATLPCPPANPLQSATRTLIAVYPGERIDRYSRPGNAPVYVATVNLEGPGPQGTAGPISAPNIAARSDPRIQIRTARATTATNGDFYYISTDNSPWGAVVARGGHLIKTASQPRPALIINSQGLASFGAVRPTITLTVGARTVRADTLNNHILASDGISVFKANWGSVSRGIRATRQVREIAINSAGIIIRISSTLTRSGIPGGGMIVAAQGTALGKLRGWAVGQRVRLTTAARADGLPVYSSIGTGMQVLSNGRYANLLCTADNPVARTVIGVGPGGRTLFLMTVQGQTDSASSQFAGMSVRSAAAAIKALGAYNASMLDGGGSTILNTRVAGGYAMLTRSPSGRIRPVANSFAVWTR